MKILVLASQNPQLSRVLNPLTEKHTVTWADGPDQVGPSLLSAQPEVVFSIKHSGFPGESHRPAIQFPSVRWFHVGGSGTDHLGSWDVDKVTVTNSAGVLAPFHAERSLAALLAISTGLKTQWAAQSQKTWLPTRFTSLRGKRLLIVGVGQTGGALADLASALGMTVLGLRASASPHPSVHSMHKPEEFHDLLGLADVISLHLRATESNTGFMGSQEFGLLKRDAILLNGARGSLIHEASLLKALDTQHLAGVWLDVFLKEPLEPSSPLWSHPKVLMSAHCADQVNDFEARFGQLFREMLERYPLALPTERIVSPRN